MLIGKTNNIKNTIKKYDEPIAFVLGKYITGGLGVVRCLGRNKIPVLWLDSNQKHVGFLSRYCNGLTCPNPKENPQEYTDFLIKIGKILKKKGVLFPIGDIEVYIILKYRTNLEKYYYLPIADLEITKKLLNKHIFYKTLKQLDIDHPKTYFPKDISDIKKLSKKITYPCIIKPSYSADFMIDFNTKLFSVKSTEDLIKFYKIALTKNHDVIIQEIIPGGVRNMFGFNSYYNNKSLPECVFTYQRIREWPHKFGNGCLIENTITPELEKIINTFIKKIKYHGIVDAEFKKDPRNNQYYLIEINPRCWMQNSLPARLGVNISYITYLDAIGKKYEKQIIPNKNVKWLFFFEDLLSSFQSILKRDLSLKEWLNSLKGYKEYSLFARDDPLPFVIFYLKSIYFWIPKFLSNFYS